MIKCQQKPFRFQLLESNLVELFPRNKYSIVPNRNNTERLINIKRSSAIRSTIDMSMQSRETKKDSKEAPVYTKFSQRSQSRYWRALFLADKIVSKPVRFYEEVGNEHCALIVFLLN